MTDCFQFMEQQEDHAKAKWAEILGVSTSGYYSHLKTRGQRSARKQKIRDKVKTVFDKEGQGAYGATRICGCMRRDGWKASYPVVKRIMEEERLKSSHNRRR